MHLDEQAEEQLQEIIPEEKQNVPKDWLTVYQLLDQKLDEVIARIRARRAKG